MKSFYRYQLPLIAYALLVFVLSSFEKLPSPHIQFELFDKVIHFGEFFLFSILALRATSRWKVLAKRQWNHRLLFSTLLSLIYAASDEIHQYFVPGRYCDILDFLADMVGIIIATLLYHLFKKLQDRQLQKQQST